MAAGLFNGTIQIIDADKYIVTLQLTGCEDKVLALKWHPFFDYILASGSADNFVRVWDTKNVSIVCNYLNERMGIRILSITSQE